MLFKERVPPKVKVLSPSPTTRSNAPPLMPVISMVRVAVEVSNSESLKLRSPALLPGDKVPLMVVAPPMVPEPPSVALVKTLSTPVAPDWSPLTMREPALTVVEPL